MSTLSKDRSSSAPLQSTIDAQELFKSAREARRVSEELRGERQRRTNTGPRQHGLAILVVEDVADTADSLAILLRLQGHRPSIARSGPETLAACRELPPDVILLDIGLPGMNGWDVAKQIRQMRFEKMPLLVAVTGYGQDGDKRQSEEVGIELHLTKPVEPDALMDLLTRFERVIGTTLPPVAL